MVTEKTIQTSTDGRAGVSHLRLAGAAGLSVCLSRPVLEEIRRVAVDRFLAIPRGGLEIGGVLFGAIFGDGVSVTALEPLECEYLTGPSFTLSSSDEERLAALLYGRDDGTVPVGWYHTHTRSDLSLSEADANIHERFFGDPRQIALIVKPFRLDPAQAAVYAGVQGPVAEADAAIRFTIEPWSAEQAAAAATAAAPSDAVAFATASTPFVEPDVETRLIPARTFVPLPDPASARARRRRRLVRAASVIVLAVIGTAGLLLTAGRYMPTPRGPVPLDLQVAGPGSTLTISWNPEAVPDREVQIAELMIVEGGYAPTMVPLAVDELRRGSLNYVRSTGNVEVRLRLHRTDGKLQQHVTRFLSGAPVVEEQQQQQVVAAPEQSVEAKVIVPSAALPQPVRQESERARRQLPFSPPPPAKRAGAEPVLTATDLRLSATPLPQQTTPELPAVQLPPPPQPQAPQQAAPPQRASGRAIWTGKLGADGVLLIDGGRPSSGALNGRISARVSRVRVHAADLVDSGIVVYADRSGVEPPSAANGWNLTTYRPDPKRSRSISVLEQPSPQNGYRLMVRAEGRPVTMIVIDWQE